MNSGENTKPSSKQEPMPLVRFLETTPLFTIEDIQNRHPSSSKRTIENLLHRLRKQGRVRAVARGVYSGASSATPLNRYAVPAKLRRDAVVAFHSALEFHGVANQVFQTVYYLSSTRRRDVAYEGVVYHQAKPPIVLQRSRGLDYQIELAADQVKVTNRERSFVDCLFYLEYSGGAEELDRCLATFPSFDFEATLQYLKLLGKPWLYPRLGYLLDRHSDKLYFSGKWRDAFLTRRSRGVVYLDQKRPGCRWVDTWKLMVPQSLAPKAEERTEA